MSQQEFEARVLEMWMNTRIPLTRANLMAYTRAPRKRMERWLDEMVAEGVVEVDADDDGEMVWTVKGAVRPASGAQTMAEYEKFHALRSDVDHTRTALTLAARAGSLATRGRHHGGSDEKSVVGSAALSLIFGPIGWLYAAPMREAVPAILIYFGLFFWLPFLHFFLAPLLPIAHIVAALAGAAYAWRYNERGERTPLAEDIKALPGKR